VKLEIVYEGSLFSYIILKGKFAIIVTRYKICTAKMLSKVDDKTLRCFCHD